MNAYLQIKRIHSKKKEKDYTVAVLSLFGEDYLFNLDVEAVSLILDKSTREVKTLPLGYESDKFEIKLDEEPAKE